MKTNFVALAVLLALCSLTGCSKKSSTDQPPGQSAQQSSASAPAGVPGTPPFEGGRKTSFQEVTTQLDPGGSIFFYLATDQWLAKLSTQITDFRRIVLSLPLPGMENRPEIEHAVDLVTRLVQTSGVEDVTGVGVSGAPIAPGLFRNKFILHHRSGAGQGFLWSMFGRSPHALSGPQMLPANTALAVFGDLDVAQLWQVLEREMTQSGIPEAAEAARSFPKMFEKQTQIPWAPLLASLGGEIGVALTLDETRKIPIPTGRNNPMEIPGPGLLVAIKVKSELLYEQISAKLQENPKTATSEESGWKFCTMPFPLPLPISLAPTVASSGDYFYFATSPDLVRAAQAVRQGKTPGLKTSPDFQALAKYLPAEGNQFIYVAKSLAQTLSGLQEQAVRGSGVPEEQMTQLRRLIGTGGPGYSLAIGAHTATGWHTTSVGNRDSATGALLLPTVAVTAVGAALVLPVVAKAKGRGQTISSVNQVKQLGLAARMYANDHNDKFPNAKTWCDDIKEFVGNAKVYKAPNDPGSGECSFAFNEKLSGMDESKVNPQTVLFFETESGWNRSGGPELMLSKPRSGGSFVIGLADGSVQQTSESRVRSLRWNP